MYNKKITERSRFNSNPGTIHFIKLKKGLCMDIINLDFEEPLTLVIAGQKVQLIAFKTLEPGNIKFGIDAPRTVQVHREEIYQAIKHKKDTTD